MDEKVDKILKLIEPNLADGVSIMELRQELQSIICPVERYQTNPKNQAYREKYNKEASDYYENKMLQLGALEEMVGWVENQGDRVHLPHHLMYRVGEPIVSADGHRSYEFLIEYHRKKPSEGIYYGCRGNTCKGFSHDEEIEVFRSEWLEVKDELARVLNNNFPEKDFSQRFKMTDNANDNTYWLFWISLVEDEDINQVGVSAVKVIRTFFEKYLFGELSIGNNGLISKMNPKKLSVPRAFTNECYRDFLLLCHKGICSLYNRIDNFPKNKKTIFQKSFSKYIKRLEKNNVLKKDEMYECAWRFCYKNKLGRSTNVDFSLMTTALYQIVVEEVADRQFPSDTKRDPDIPWSAFCRIFLSDKGDAYDIDSVKNSIKIKKSDKSDDYTKYEKYEAQLNEWKKKIRGS